jgi:hypothetical protein
MVGNLVGLDTAVDRIVVSRGPAWGGNREEVTLKRDLFVYMQGSAFFAATVPPISNNAGFSQTPGQDV